MKNNEQVTIAEDINSEFDSNLKLKDELCNSTFLPSEKDIQALLNHIILLALPMPSARIH